jgi:hypothetical protein
LRCLVDTGELKKVCQAIFWSVGQFDEDTGAPLPLRIEAGSSTITFSLVNKEHFVEFQIKSKVEMAGVVFVSFSSLKSLCEHLETALLYFVIKDKKFIIESEDGRILLNSLQMDGWVYPEKPTAFVYRCQSFLLNRISRQILSSAGDKDLDKSLAIKYNKKTQALWLEQKSKLTSCLGKIFCRGGEDIIFLVSPSKFCNMMRAITSWHVAETAFLVGDGYAWFYNGTGLFKIPCEKNNGLPFGSTHVDFQANKASLQKVNLMRAGLVSILETCVAADPSNDMVRFDWLNHNGQDKLRVTCKGSKCDVVRYSSSQGLVKQQVALPARRLLDFLKTYMDPIAQFEVGSDTCYISIPRQVRFGICLKSKPKT